jgi:hypothetical protein
MGSSYNVYNTGDAVIFTATFKKADGELVDPTEIHLRVKRSSGEIDELTAERQSLGVWRATYSLIGKTHGEYQYRWTGTGTVQVASQGAFYVLPVSVPN